jgi:hypothetical protein
VCVCVCVCRRLRALGMPGSRRQEAGLTATAWSLCWGGICCVCSLLPALPPRPALPILAGCGTGQTHPCLGDRCVLAEGGTPAWAFSLAPPPLASQGECPVPGGIASLLSRLLLPIAGFVLTMKGLRFGFRSCCGCLCPRTSV